MTFYKKIIIFSLAISIIPLLLLGIFIFYGEKEDIEKEAIRKIALIGDLKRQRLEEYLAAKKNAGDFYRHRYVVTSELPALKSSAGSRSEAGYEAVKKILDANQQSFLENFGFDSVLIVDTAGKVMYAFPEDTAPWKPGETVTDMAPDMFKNDPGKVVLGDIHKSHGNKKGYEMHIYSPIYDDKGGAREALALAILTFDMKNIFEFVQDTQGMGNTGETLLGKFHPSGTEDVLIGKKSGHALFLNTLRFDSSAALYKKIYIGDASGISIQRAVIGENGSGITRDYRGKRVIAAWRFMPSLGWGLVTKVDADEALSPVITLLVRLAVTIAVAIIAIIAFGFYSAQHVKKSIDLLKKCAEEVGGGNLDCRTNSKSTDEIGQISRYFDRMVESLKHSTASVEVLNKEMAERKKLELSLREKMKELEIFNKAAVDREIKMAELKKKIREFEEKNKQG